MDKKERFLEEIYRLYLDRVKVLIAEDKIRSKEREEKRRIQQALIDREIVVYLKKKKEPV